jgi:hypothetical protein
MSSLRAFNSSWQPPGADGSDDQTAQTQASAQASSAPDSSAADSAVPPAQQPQYAPPQPDPGHQDPYVGPGKAVDPKDHIFQTPDLPLDLDALRKKLTDPLGTDKPSQDPGGPGFGGPPPGSAPPGPDYTWDPILQGWKKVKDADPPLPVPPPADPPAPGDYESPDGDSAPA